MSSMIKDAFRYFMPFLILIILFFAYVQTKSSHKNKFISNINVSNDKEIQNYSNLPLWQRYDCTGGIEQIKYVKYLAQKYPSFYIYSYNDYVTIKAHTDDVFSLQNSLSNNNLIYLPYDFVILQNYGFKKLRIIHMSANYKPITITFTGQYGSWQQITTD